MMDDGNEYPFGPERVFTKEGRGGLAISRALGNATLRPAVSGEPDCSTFLRDGKRDLFVLVATDGVWDVFGAREACAVVRDELELNNCADCSRGQKEAAQKAAARLVREALGRGSQDNAAAVVINLAVGDGLLGAAPRSYPG